MHGVNLGGWFSQVNCIEEKDPDAFPGVRKHVESFLGHEDFRRIKAWGFDHVRLPVDYDNLFQEPGLDPNSVLLDRLDEAIRNISAEGLGVILDLHRCPGNDFLEGLSSAQSLYTDSSLLQRTKLVWAQLAERYGSHRGVLLEILNEPVAENSGHWNVVKDQLVQHIRRHAPRSTIVVGSNRWNSPLEFASLTPVDDDNVVYNFHFYTPVLFTHQNAPWIDGSVFRVARPYPGDYSVPEGTKHRLPLDVGRWDRSRLRLELEQPLQFREHHKVPVSCNEFGAYVAGPDRASQLRWMGDLLSAFQEHEIGWTYWNYKNLDFGILSRGERLFADYPQYDNDERVDRELVEVLRSKRGVCRYLRGPLCP